MRRSACGLVASFVFGVGMAVAQNGPSVQHIQQRTSLQECLNTSEHERLQWEAAATWSSPAHPHTNAEANYRPIHIEAANQPPLPLPKLRREWLQPSSETAIPASTASDIQAQEERGIEHFVPNSKQDK